MMQFLRYAALVGLALVSPGCVVTQYHKEVVVTMDGDGKVVSVVVTERIDQPDGQARPMVFEYIQLVPIHADSQQPTPTLVPVNAK